MTTKFRVLGAGVWGLAFSDHLLNLGHSVEIFRRDTLEKQFIKIEESLDFVSKTCK